MTTHTRKQGRADAWRPKVGRDLMHEISGSMALTAKARTVFVMQPVSPDMEDDRVIFEVAKCNNDKAPGRSAWHRRNGLFVPCVDFDWDEWMNPPEEGRREVTEEELAAVFAKGGPSMAKGEAVRAIKALGYSTATAYRVLDVEKGKFKDRLWVTQNGRLAWRPAGEKVA